MEKTAAELKREYHHAKEQSPEYKAKKAQYQKDTKEARNAYLRKWRAEHPDKVKEYDNRYWEKKAAEYNAAAAAEETKGE